MSCWLEYSVQIHKCLIADSITEAVEKIKPVAAELERLASWEKEGKITSFGSVDRMGFLDIKLNDDSNWARTSRDETCPSDRI